MVEADAVEFHIEKLRHGQLAPRVSQADDDAVDRANSRDCRNVLNGADDARIENWRAHLVRIGIDEADDLDTEIVPPIVDFASKIDCRLSGSDEQQALP